MDEIKIFDDNLYDFLYDYIEKNNSYFKINICIYTNDYKISHIYTLVYEEIFGKMHIFNLKNQFVSFVVCKTKFIDAVNELCEIIKRDFGDAYGYGNPFGIVKIGNLFS